MSVHLLKNYLGLLVNETVIGYILKTKSKVLHIKEMRVVVLIVFKKLFDKSLTNGF